MPGSSVLLSIEHAGQGFGNSPVEALQGVDIGAHRRGRVGVAESGVALFQAAAVYGPPVTVPQLAVVVSHVPSPDQYRSAAGAAPAIATIVRSNPSVHLFILSLPLHAFR